MAANEPHFFAAWNVDDQIVKPKRKRSGRRKIE